MGHGRLILPLIVSFSTIILIFIIGEFIIRLYANNNIIYDIEMAKYAKVMKNDSFNKKTVYTHLPNTRAKLMNVDISINSDGLRDKEYTIKKNNSYRIIFLGDSITFGWGVAEENTFENILETELNKKKPVEIFNFGIGNYNTEQEVNLFLEKGLKYNPDKVVIFYFINDAEMTPQPSRLASLGNSELLTFYWSRINKIFSKFDSAKNYQHYYSGLYKQNNPGWGRTQDAFLMLKKISLENNFQLQIVILPDLHKLDNYPFVSEHSLITAFLEDANIEYFDLLTIFNGFKYPQDLWVTTEDTHPNTKAHKIIADNILEFIYPKN